MSGRVRPIYEKFEILLQYLSLGRKKASLIKKRVFTFDAEKILHLDYLNTKGAVQKIVKKTVLQFYRESNLKRYILFPETPTFRIKTLLSTIAIFQFQFPKIKVTCKIDEEQLPQMISATQVNLFYKFSIPLILYFYSKSYVD